MDDILIGGLWPPSEREEHGGTIALTERSAEPPTLRSSPTATVRDLELATR